MVMITIHQQRDEIGVTLWHTIGTPETMEDAFPNFCLFLIGIGVLSYIMAICQLFVRPA